MQASCALVSLTDTSHPRLLLRQHELGCAETVDFLIPSGPGSGGTNALAQPGPNTWAAIQSSWPCILRAWPAVAQPTKQTLSVICRLVILSEYNLLGLWTLGAGWNAKPLKKKQIGFHQFCELKKEKKSKFINVMWVPLTFLTYPQTTVIFTSTVIHHLIHEPIAFSHLHDLTLLTYPQTTRGDCGRRSWHHLPCHYFASKVQPCYIVMMTLNQ